jgi:hypothetical protein
MTPLQWIGASVLAVIAFAVTLYFQKRGGKPFDDGDFPQAVTTATAAAMGADTISRFARSRSFPVSLNGACARALPAP